MITIRTNRTVLRYYFLFLTIHIIRICEQVKIFKEMITKKIIIFYLRWFTYFKKFQKIFRLSQWSSLRWTNNRIRARILIIYLIQFIPYFHIFPIIYFSILQFTTRIVNIPYCNYSNLTSRYTFANFVFENLYKIEHISRGQVGIEYRLRPSRVQTRHRPKPIFCLFSGHKNSSYAATTSPIASPSFKGWMRGKSRCMQQHAGE